MNQSVDANQAEWQVMLEHYGLKAATQTLSPTLSLSIKIKYFTMI
jgi:outer membrane protein TolC